MGDGYSGSGTGGVTGIQPVKASSNSSCITTAITQPEHVFDVYGTYIQCSVLSMNWTEPATSSTRVTGLVPNGVAFQLDPPVANSKSTTWDLNIPGGTAFVLMYVTPSGPGLTSQLLVSQANGGNNACLSSGAYPSATASQTGIAQATGTLRASSSATPTGEAPVSSVAPGSSTRKHRFARVRPHSPDSGKEINLESDTRHLDDGPACHRGLPEGAVLSPFELPRPTSTRETQPSSNRKGPFLPRTRSTTTHRMSETLTSAESSQDAPATSSARRELPEAEDSEPVYIQHADGGAVPIQPRPREVIELPPTYDQLPRPSPRSRNFRGSDQVQSQAESQRKM
ncbi:hypothetical protein FRC10_002321 [Ceratobasidium sp. 414]|nr:hypothetical protein FRC10_002321 [Ceratobasidium sp. 414]